MTTAFTFCLWLRQELLLTGYARSFKLPYTIPVDVVETCTIFLSTAVILPLIPLINDASDDDHSCEEETVNQLYVLKTLLSGIDKYQYIKTLKIGSGSLLPHQFRLQLPYEYTNSYHALKPGTNVIVDPISHIFDSLTNSIKTLRELKIFDVLRYHPHIQMLYDVTFPSEAHGQHFDALNFVLESTDMNLYSMFISRPCLNEIHIKYILYQIVVTVKHIHACNIYHADLTPHNILISSDCFIKISNFKNAHCIQPTMSTDAHSLSSHQKPTRRRKPLYRRQRCTSMNYTWYDSPEAWLLNHESIENKTAADVWSIGMIFAELLHMLASNGKSKSPSAPLFGVGYQGGYIPHKTFKEARCIDLLALFQVIGSPKYEEIESMEDESVRQFMHSLPQHKFNRREFKRKYFPGIDDSVLDLLLSLLRFDPEQRMSVNDILNHSFLTDVRNSVYESLVVSQLKNSRFEGVYCDQRKHSSIRDCILHEIQKYKM